MHEVLLDENGIRERLDYLRQEIMKGEHRHEDLVLVGIQRRGAHLAERLGKLLSESLQREVPQGVLDISLYRDDVSRRTKLPIVRPTRLDFNINDKTVILVDDVLFTGRTVRAGMNELMDYGRAASIRLAVLVDRGCRELPIQPDYVGLTHEVGRDRRVYVYVTETDGRDEVFVKEDHHAVGS